MPFISCAALYVRESQTEGRGSGEDCFCLYGIDPPACCQLYGYTVLYLRSVSVRGTDNYHAALHDAYCGKLCAGGRRSRLVDGREHRTGGEPDKRAFCARMLSVRCLSTGRWSASTRMILLKYQGKLVLMRPRSFRLRTAARSS